MDSLLGYKVEMCLSLRLALPVSESTYGLLGSVILLKSAVKIGFV